MKMRIVANTRCSFSVGLGGCAQVDRPRPLPPSSYNRSLAYITAVTWTGETVFILHDRVFNSSPLLETAVISSSLSVYSHRMYVDAVAPCHGIRMAKQPNGDTDHGMDILEPRKD